MALQSQHSTLLNRSFLPQMSTSCSVPKLHRPGSGTLVPVCIQVPNLGVILTPVSPYHPHPSNNQGKWQFFSSSWPAPVNRSICFPPTHCLFCCHNDPPKKKTDYIPNLPRFLHWLPVDLIMKDSSFTGLLKSLMSWPYLPFLPHWSILLSYIIFCTCYTFLSLSSVDYFFSCFSFFTF